MASEKKSPKGYRVLCPFCGQKARLIDSAEIYNGKSYGYAYVCEYCGDGKSVFALCKPGTVKIQGKMADAETRQLRQKAYRAYKRYVSDSRSFYSDAEAREWLSRKIGVAYANCRISEFDARTCRKVLEVCSEKEAV